VLFAARHVDGDKNSLYNVVFDILQAQSFNDACRGTFKSITGKRGSTNEEPEMTIGYLKIKH